MNKRPDLVKWRMACLDKKGGVLGIKSLAIFNKALLLPMKLAFVNERDVFWNQVVRGKYEEEQGGWCTKIVSNSYGVGVWKAVRKECNILAGKMSFAVGNGKRVLF